MRKGVEANNQHPHLKGKHFCPIEAKKAPGERLQHMQERLTWRYWVVLPDWSTSLFNCLTWIDHKKWLKPSSYLPIVLSDHLMQCIYHTSASPYTTVSLKSNPHAERSRSQQPTSSFERETLLPYRREESTWGEVAAQQERLTWRYWVVLPDWSTSLFNCLTWIEHKNWLKPSSYLPIVLSDHLMQCIYHTSASPYTTVSLKSNPHAERSRSQQPTSSFERETLLPYRSEESTWGEVAAHARALDMKALGCFARLVYFTLQLFDMDWP